jgi:hypothetical protein
MAGFEGNAGAKAGCLTRQQGDGVESEYVVAEVFSGMSDNRGPRSWFQQFYAKHS